MRIKNLRCCLTILLSSLLFYFGAYSAVAPADNGASSYYLETILKEAESSELKHAVSRLSVSRLTHNVREYSFDPFSIQKLQSISMSSTGRNYCFLAYEKYSGGNLLNLDVGGDSLTYAPVKSKAIVSDSTKNYFDMELLAGSHNIRSSFNEVEIVEQTAQTLLSERGLTSYDDLIGTSITGRINRGGGDFAPTSFKISAVYRQEGVGWDLLNKLYGNRVLFMTESFSASTPETLVVATSSYRPNAVKVASSVYNFYFSEKRTYGGFSLGYQSAMEILTYKNGSLVANDVATSNVNRYFEVSKSGSLWLLTAFSLAMFALSLIALWATRSWFSEFEVKKPIRFFTFAGIALFSFLLFAICVSVFNLPGVFLGLPSSLLGNYSAFIVVLSAFLYLGGIGVFVWKPKGLFHGKKQNSIRHK